MSTAIRTLIQLCKPLSVGLYVVVLLGAALPGYAQVRATAGTTMQGQLPLIDTDTLLYVDNRGLDRIFVTLSGHHFRLVADPSEVDRSANAFPIPRTGEVTIHVGAFIEPGDGNYVRLASQGPPGADADVVIAPVFVRGQSEVAYRIGMLEPLPEQFRVRNYPNPFSERTTVEYEIPADRINGADIVIEIYDVLGRRVVTVDAGRRYPGTFRYTWQVPAELGSGIYFCRIRAQTAQGEVQKVAPLTVVR
jgi:hypothetical protein